MNFSNTFKILKKEEFTEKLKNGVKSLFNPRFIQNYIKNKNSKLNTNTHIEIDDDNESNENNKNSKHLGKKSILILNQENEMYRKKI